MEKKLSNKKVVLVIILCIVGQAAIQLVMVPILLLPVPEFLASVVMGGLYLCLTWFFVKWLAGNVLHRELEEFRITRIKGDKIQVAELLAGVMLPILLYLLLVPGRWEIYSLSPMRFCITFVKAFGCVGLGAALVEELLFRGMVLRLIEMKLGTKCALVLPALFWAVLHLITADFSNGISPFVRVLSVTYAGVVFSVITVMTGSIWNSVFFHTMWNFITSGVVNIGPSANDHVMFNYIPAGGNILLSGGENGIDGSVITLVCYTVVMLVSIRMNRGRFGDEKTYIHGN